MGVGGRAALGLVAVAIGLAACQLDRSTKDDCPVQSATNDTAADALFRRDSRWLGGDGAWSVALGNDRVLWTFGDSFVGKGSSRSRRDAAFLRNTVAIQTGLDPGSASMQFFWRGTDAPSSFVAETSPSWYWPMGGAVANGALILFYVQEKATTSALGFEASGNLVLTVNDPSAPPPAWALVPRTFPLPGGVPLTMMAPLTVGDTLYVWAIRDPGDHAVSVAKVRASDVPLGDLSKALWWCGKERGWLAASEAGTPASIFPGTGTDLPSELSVSVRKDGTFVAIHSVGFGATTLAMRTAPRAEGPWSEPCPFFTPPESGAPSPFVYAGKGHAELTGSELVATYVASSRDDQKLLGDMSLYFPRIVRADLSRVADAGARDSAADR